MTDNAQSLSPLIHLVDDDAAVRDSLSLLISTVGLRVQAWADPQSFMAGFDRASIGAIVLDVRMPGISGLTVLEQLLAQGVDQPMILLTGHGTVEMCRRAFKAGAAEFLEKPVDDEVLIEAARARHQERQRPGQGEARRCRWQAVPARRQQDHGPSRRRCFGDRIGVRSGRFRSQWLAQGGDSRRRTRWQYPGSGCDGGPC